MTVMDNEGAPSITDLAAGWNSDEGRHWVKFQERYDAFRGRLTPHLLRGAELSESDVVLDVGCGCGETTLLAARATSSGSVLGVDLSAPMLSRARQRAVAEGVANVEFVQADAQSYGLPDAEFDVIISRFGVMFFADPELAFFNLARALRPGGRLVFLCWQEAVANEWIVVPGAAVAQFVDITEGIASKGPGPFSLADPAILTGLLEQAGFVTISLEPVIERLLYGIDIEDVIDLYSQMPMVRSLLAGVDDETKAAGIDAVRLALRPYAGPDGVLLRSAAWLVNTHRPT